MRDPRTPRALAGAATVPIWPIGGDGRCTCPGSTCNAPGKHPRPDGIEDPAAGYGILTGVMGSRGSGVFVVDCDERQGVSGIDRFAELCALHGEPLPSTLIVATGGRLIDGVIRPGYHFYFEHPGFPIKSSTAQLAPCVDVKGDPDRGFSFVVGPGSPHLSGNAYRVVHDAPLARAPNWLLEWPGLRKTSADLASLEGDAFAFAPTPIDCTTPEGLRRMAAYISECRGETGNLAPAVWGERGSDRMYAAAARGLIHYVLPWEVVADVLMTHYNPRCTGVEPWSEKEIQHKISSVLKKNRDITPGPAPEQWGGSLVLRAVVGAEAAANSSEIIGARRPNLSHKYQMSLGDVAANGKLTSKSTSTLTYQLRRHPDWIGVLQYDEFTETVRAVNPPIQLDAETGPLTEEDITAIKVWFEAVCDTAVSSEVMRSCVESVARKCRVHSVRDYLLALPPGDPSVLEGLAAEWFGANEPLDREILTRFLVGSVRRALVPGTKVDTMLVLYGNQGYKKSQWIKALYGDQYSSEQMPDLSRGADASQSIATVWAQEFPELDKLLKVDPKTAKDFLSRVVDKYRPAYGRNFFTKARQAVFIGTTNEREFLRDPTGERRYWIVEVLAKIDLDKVRAMRDQVWAAALALAMRGDYEHWFETGDQWDLALTERQKAYSQGDAWTGPVLEYCSGLAETTVLDIYRDVIAKGDAGFLAKLDFRGAARIEGILRRAGARKPRGSESWALPSAVTNAPLTEREANRRKFTGRVLSIVPGGVK